MHRCFHKDCQIFVYSIRIVLKKKVSTPLHYQNRYFSLVFKNFKSSINNQYYNRQVAFTTIKILDSISQRYSSKLDYEFSSTTISSLFKFINFYLLLLYACSRMKLKVEIYYLINALFLKNFKKMIAYVSFSCLRTSVWPFSRAKFCSLTR